MITAADIAGYTAPVQAPTHVSYKGLDVYSMAPPSSGGTTVGEALNILANFDVDSGDQVQALHLYHRGLRRSPSPTATAGSATRRSANVPTKPLLSPQYARPRLPDQPDQHADQPGRARRPVRAGRRHDCSAAAPTQTSYTVTEGMSTRTWSTADKWGNVVSYTLTIEQTGGSAMTVPGRGFLLNNEMTDFDFTPLHPAVPDPNLPAAASGRARRCRRRSC